MELLIQVVEVVVGVQEIVLRQFSKAAMAVQES
jgi:hypothetical protein